MTIEAARGTEAYLESFSQSRESLNGRAPAEIDRIRQEAFDRFTHLGFPTTRHEEWKYTNVSPIARTHFRLGTAEGADAVTPEQIAPLVQQVFGTTGSDAPGVVAPTADSPRIGGRGAASPPSFQQFPPSIGGRGAGQGAGAPLLVFVNGRFVASISSLAEMGRATVTNLAHVLSDSPDQALPYLTRLAAYRDHSFAALNTAFLQDGAIVHVPRGQVIEAPIRLLYLSTSGHGPTMSHPRTLVVLEENSQATVVEAYVDLGQEATFTNSVTEIVVEDHAVLDHYRIQQGSDNGYAVSVLQARQGRSSNYSCHSFMMGHSLLRNDAGAIMGGEGGEGHLNGLYLASGRQHIDNHTAIDHALPNCNSREIYHGILSGASTGVFNGKILVRQDAQKTDARQTNRNLLLSDQATIDTKPQLEIFADDVKCTHGATVGRLDEDSVFYLRSRGIPREEAESLLTYAFASEIVEGIRLKSLQDPLRRMIEQWLSQSGRRETNR